MQDAKTPTSVSDEAEKPTPSPPKKRRSRWRKVGIALLVLIGLLAIVRPMLPWVVRWYVNRAIDRSIIYEGRIGDIDLHLWRGAYTIRDIQLNKTTGNVPVPLFAAPRVDLAVQWEAVFHGRIVGQIV